MNLMEEELRNEIYRLAPFRHNIELPYGLSTYIPELSRRRTDYTRVSSLVQHAFPSLLAACGGSLEGKRVLDVACNCGGFSVEASKLGAEYVMGIDIVDRYIEQATFVKRALGLKHVEFKVMDLNDLDSKAMGEFDVTFFFGILYHLENPVSTMRRLCALTRRVMLIDTAVWRIPATRDPCWLMKVLPEPGQNSPSSNTNLWRTGTEIIQFKPNESAVLELMKFLEFSNVKKLEPKAEGLEKRYYLGKRITFLAVR